MAHNTSNVGRLSQLANIYFNRLVVLLNIYEAIKVIVFSDLAEYNSQSISSKVIYLFYIMIIVGLSLEIDIMQLALNIASGEKMSKKQQPRKIRRMSELSKLRLNYSFFVFFSNANLWNKCKYTLTHLFLTQLLNERDPKMQSLIQEINTSKMLFLRLLRSLDSEVVGLKNFSFSFIINMILHISNDFIFDFHQVICIGYTSIMLLGQKDFDLNKKVTNQALTEISITNFNYLRDYHIMSKKFVKVVHLSLNCGKRRGNDFPYLSNLNIQKMTIWDILKLSNTFKPNSDFIIIHKLQHKNMSSSRLVKTIESTQCKTESLSNTNQFCKEVPQIVIKSFSLIEQLYKSIIFMPAKPRGKLQQLGFYYSKKDNSK